VSNQQTQDQPEDRAAADEPQADVSPAADAPVGEGDAPDLAAQLEQAKAQAAEYLDGWQRSRAELDNYRKRMARERTEWDDSLRTEVVLGVLPAIDDLDLALANLPEDLSRHDWINGLLLARRKLETQLQAMGIAEVEARGHFDPALHEAVTHEPSKDHESGQIIAVVRKGYKIGDRVIRPTMVRVAS